MEKNEDINWVKLVNVANDIEFSIIEGMMKMGNIPVVRKLKGMDGYLNILTGSPIAHGIDVLVPAERFDEAKSLLEAETGNEEEK